MDPRKRGTRAEVLSGIALMTSGGLRAEDLMTNVRGKIVSKKKFEAGHAMQAHKKAARPPTETALLTALHVGLQRDV